MRGELVPRPVITDLSTGRPHTKVMLHLSIQKSIPLAPFRNGSYRVSHISFSSAYFMFSYWSGENPVRRTRGGQWGREVLPGGAGPGVELCRLSRAFPVPRFNRVCKMPGGACGVAQKRGVTPCGMNARKKLASNDEV